MVSQHNIWKLSNIPSFDMQDIVDLDMGFKKRKEQVL